MFKYILVLNGCIFKFKYGKGMNKSFEVLRSTCFFIVKVLFKCIIVHSVLSILITSLIQVQLKSQVRNKH